MGIYDNLKVLCKEQNKTIQEMENDLGFTRGSAYKFNAHAPSVDKVMKMADYFCVSMEKVMGVESEENHDVNLLVETIKKCDDPSATARRLLSYYHFMAEEDKK